mgnify:CR=1 FL=1
MSGWEMNTLQEELERLIAEQLSENELDGPDVGNATEQVIHDVLPAAADQVLASMKDLAPETLKYNRELEEGFRQRNYERWARGLDLIEILVAVADETGQAINRAERPQAIEENDARFEAVVMLHGRAILVSREILCLMKGGFPDGALGRWRTLHEIAVVAHFLASQDRDISERYLLHRDVQAHKAMKQYREHQDRANLTPISEEDVEQARNRADAIIANRGKEMKHDWGWAAPVIGRQKPTLLDLEENQGLDHWRPRYKWASQDTHGGYRPPSRMLGTSEANDPVILGGPSNSGLTDPAHMTAISLVLATTALICLKPNLDRLLTQQVCQKLVDEIGEAFLNVDS